MASPLFGPSCNSMECSAYLSQYLSFLRWYIKGREYWSKIWNTDITAPITDKLTQSTSSVLTYATEMRHPGEVIASRQSAKPELTKWHRSIFIQFSSKGPTGPQAHITNGKLGPLALPSHAPPVLSLGTVRSNYLARMFRSSTIPLFLTWNVSKVRSNVITKSRQERRSERLSVLNWEGKTQHPSKSGPKKRICLRWANDVASRRNVVFLPKSKCLFQVHVCQRHFISFRFKIRQP